MTATATGLMDRAQLALVDLKQTTAPVTPDQWSCFDQTVYRLLHELVEARTGWLLADPVVLRLRRAYCHYPRPLQPADARVDFSIKETARFLGTSDKVIRKRISDGVMLAAPTDAGYRIPRSELSLGQPPVPSPTSDNHPLARMACILGALTDLLAINRMEPSLPELRAESAAWIGREALALTEVAARSVLSTCEPGTADRPLTIARYAARTSTEILASRPPQGLQDPQVPQPQHRATTHPSLLANSIHQWTRAARHELREQVPRVAVLKDINRQGVHINAALDATLSRLGPDGNDWSNVRAQLRSSAQSLQAGVDAWSQTTTGAPPSRCYVEASRLLYAQLSHVTLDAATIKEPSEAIYQALLRGANEVAWTTSLATPHAARLLRSGVVFVHARYARADTRRLNDRMAGRAVVAGPDDLPGLSRRAWEAERSAIQAARYLPSSLSIALAPQAASVAEL